MFKTRYLAAAMLAGAAFMSTPALAADSPVVGSWATEAKSDFGTFKAVWTVAQDGDSYTVDVKDEPPEGGGGGGGGGPPGGPPQSTISDVMVDGNTLTFKRELMIGDMTIDLNYTVTVDGDTMTGNTHSDFGDIPITGMRQ